MTASLLSPEQVATDGRQILWLLPLTILACITYKATKLPEIKMRDLIKETAILVGFMMVLAVVTTLTLWVFAYVFTQ